MARKAPLDLRVFKEYLVPKEFKGFLDCKGVQAYLVHLEFQGRLGLLAHKAILVCKGLKASRVFKGFQESRGLLDPKETREEGGLNKESYRPDEVAEILGVSKRAVYRHRGKFKLAGNDPIRISRDSLPINRKVIGYQEVMARLCISHGTAYNWFNEGRLDGVKLGPKTIRFFEDSVEALLNQSD